MLAIETPRLRLRRLLHEDLDEYYARVFAEPQVMRMLPPGRPMPREAFDARLPALIDGHWEKHGFGPWLVCDRAEGAILGHCGLKYWPDSTDVEVLYALTPGAWGRGIATEAARASVAYGFERLALDRIVAAAFLDNPASRRVLEKIGLRYVEERPFAGRTVAWYELAGADYVPDGSPYRAIEP